MRPFRVEFRVRFSSSNFSFAYNLARNGKEAIPADCTTIAKGICIRILDFCEVMDAFLDAENQKSDDPLIGNDKREREHDWNGELDEHEKSRGD